MTTVRKKYFIQLCNWSIHSTRMPWMDNTFASMDHMHYVGKCRCTRTVMYHILWNYILCWHSYFLSGINKILAVPHVLSVHMFLPLCIHQSRCTKTSSADMEDSFFCSGCSFRTSNWLNMWYDISPFSLFRFFYPKMLLKHFHLRYTHKL